MNVNLSYKPPSSWRIIFLSGGYSSQFSCLKQFSALMVPSGGCNMEIIIQVIMTPMGVLPNGQSFLRIKLDLTVLSVHAPRQRNITYI